MKDGTSNALRIRSAIKAGRGGYDIKAQHNEALRLQSTRAISMRREVPDATRKRDRLELLVVRAGLRAGRRGRHLGWGNGRGRGGTGGG